MKIPAFLCILACLSPVAADTLQPLGDEFDDARSLAQWRDLAVVEGWGSPAWEAADINTTTPGHFRIVPGANTWYNHLRGLLFYKEISGDFVATTRVRVLSRHNPADPLEVPDRSFSLTGLFVHAPRSIIQAAPVPYRTDAVWPPADFGSDYVAGTENYVFVSFGSAGSPGTRQFEIKATRNSDSRLYYSSTGLAQTDNEAWLQMVRVGNTIVCLRRHGAAGPWIVENRYPNPDHPFPDFGPVLQVGLTAYTDWETAAPYSNGGLQSSWHFNYAPPATGSPDLISEVDCVRLQRPAAALTEAVLQAMTVGYNPATDQTADPPVLLSASPAAADFLGENANVPLGLVSAAGLPGREGEVAEVTVIRSGASASRPLSVQFATETGTAGSEDYGSTSGTLTWTADDPPGKMVVIPLSRDTLAEGDESVSLVLSGMDGPAVFPGGGLRFAVPLTIRDHPWDQWRRDRFGPGVADSPAAAAAADADADGVENAVEYGLGTDPVTSVDTAALPRAVTVDSRAGLQFRPASLTPGLRLTVEGSADLVHWSDLASRAGGAAQWQPEHADAVVSVDEAGVVRVTMPVAGPVRQYVRLRASVD